jgi:hypothetical protein
MWSSDVDDSLIDLIRAAETTPRPTPTFRQQVLWHAAQARRRSASVQRVQTLTSLLLAVAVFVFLPGYYQRAQQGAIAGLATVRAHAGDSVMASATAPAEYASFSRTAWAAMAAIQPPTSTDGFEWNLISAELAAKHHSARAFGVSL